MSRVVLLPRPKNPENSWPPQDDIFRISKALVASNLSGEANLFAEGIPSPWARALLMNWRLENQSGSAGVAAISELRTLLLAQFLGRLKGELVPLSAGSDGLGRLCRVLLLSSNYSGLIVWRADNLDLFSQDEVVAGTTSDCLVFSAGDLSIDKVRESLQQGFGPLSSGNLLNGRGEVNSPDLAATLSEYLRDLASVMPSEKWRTALDDWRKELLKLGGRPVSTALRKFTLDASLTITTRTWMDRAPWDCPECIDAGHSWVNAEPTVQSLTAQRPEIRCPRHNAAIRKNSGRGEPIGYADFGSYLAKTYREDRAEFADQLYVWNEPKAWPDCGSISRVVTGRHGLSYVEHRFHNQTVRVEGQLVKLSDVLLEEVAWPAKTDVADRKPIDIPIRGEFACLLDDCKTDPVAPLWKIRLNGYPLEISKPFPDKPTSNSWATSAILVWPPEQLDGWTVDYIAASAPRADHLAFRTIETIGTNGALKVSPDRRLLGLYRTEGTAIRFVELGELDGKFKSLGLLKLERNGGKWTEGGSADVVVDFGTSNSAVLWKFAADGSPQFLYSGIFPKQVQTHAAALTISQQEIKNLERAVAVLLEWYEEPQPRPFAPSLLAEPDELHAGGPAFIPPRALGLQILMSRQRPLFGKLKWDDWNQWRTTERVGALLEALLLPAFWDLRKKGVDRWTLRATYPLAFRTVGGNRAAVYESILRRLVDNLITRVGLPAPQGIQLHSESAAGAALLQHGNSTHEVSLDLGGGTLDVAVVVGPGGAALCNAVPGTVLAADSLPYAGRDFLRAIVTAYGDALQSQLKGRLESGSGSQQGGPAVSSEISVEQLEVIINRDGISELASLLAQTGNGVDAGKLALARQSVRLRWQALLAGIKLYLRRLLQGAIRNPKPGFIPLLQGQRIYVGFNVLGQGWELLKFLDSQGPSSYLRSCFGEVCGKVAHSLKVELADHPIMNVLPHGMSPKTAVVQGALKLGQPAAQSPTAFLAVDADRRDTFLGVALRQNTAEDILEPTMRLSEIRPEQRPNLAGDIGYHRLLDELWEEIEEGDRERAKEHLLGSQTFMHKFGCDSVERYLTLEGQRSFQEAWMPGTCPEVSLLAHFLTNVWKPVWAETPLE